MKFLRAIFDIKGSGDSVADKFLAAVSREDFFPRAFSFLYKAAALLCILATTALFVSWWKVMRDFPGLAVAGGVFLQSVFAIMLYFVVRLLWIRAGDVRQVPQSDFLLTMITALTARLAGELYFVFSVFTGLAGGVMIWLAKGYAGYLLSDLDFNPAVAILGNSPTGVVGGSMFIITALFVGFLGLAAGYLVSELLLLFMKIAQRN